MAVDMKQAYSAPYLHVRRHVQILTLPKPLHEIDAVLTHDVVHHQQHLDTRHGGEDLAQRVIHVHLSDGGCK